MGGASDTSLQGEIHGSGRDTYAPGDYRNILADPGPF